MHIPLHCRKSSMLKIKTKKNNMEKLNIRNLLIGIFALLIVTGCSAKKEVADLKNTNKIQQTSLNEALQKNESATLELNSLRKENIDLTSKNKDLEVKLVSARQSINKISEQKPECPEEMKKGLVFKVQIGAYEKREIPDELTKSINLDTEKKDDLQKIIVGQFRDYQKAKSLREQLRAMGVSDAFIVTYIDDQRKQLNEVLVNKGIQE